MIPDNDLDERLHRLLADRAGGVSTEPDLQRVRADGADTAPSPRRTRIAYLVAVAAAVFLVVAGVGLAGVVGEGDSTSTEGPSDAPTDGSEAPTSEVITSSSVTAPDAAEVGTSSTSTTTTAPSTTTTAPSTTTTALSTASSGVPATHGCASGPGIDTCGPTPTTVGEPGVTVLWTIYDGVCTRFLINSPDTGLITDPTGENCG